MLLATYLNGQFSPAQVLEFFARILTACLCGASIGFERSRRYKEAGVRTHIIVCCAAALLMVVSKYGFADLTSPEGALLAGTRGADPARIAAQVVSGISFLGAGVIFRHSGSVKGLTTAAGLWATAGIGLTLGAGFYVLGVFTTVLLTLIQVLMHRFQVGGDSLLSRRLQFTVYNSGELQAGVDAFLAGHSIQTVESTITYLEDGFASYDMVVRTRRDIPIGELDRFLKTCGAVRCISYTIVG